MLRHTQYGALLGLILGLPLIGGCSTSPQMSENIVPASAVQPLLFLSLRDGDLEIYLTDANGNFVKQLTHNNSDDYDAVWSPDGRKIAYTSKQDGNAEVYVMDRDGSQQRRLTNSPGLDSSPQWSPDGKQLAFISDRDGALNVHLLDLKSGETNSLTHTKTGIVWPRWSPDGSHISFLENNLHSNSLAVIRADGSDRRTLVINPKEFISDSAWSPDGKRIAYAYDTKRGINIFTVEVGSAKTKQLTTSTNLDIHPTWSPDGQSILFLSSRDDGTRQQIYVMNDDGSNQHRIIETGHEEMNVTWSADGKYIFDTSYRDGNPEIYCMKADGTEVRRLTNSVGHDDMPSPAPLAFSKLDTRLPTQPQATWSHNVTDARFTE